MKPWLRSVWDATKSEWAFFRRERSVLVVLLFVPLAYPLIMSWLYAADQAVERPALVIDADNSALSRRLVLDLEATPELRIVGRPATLDEGLSALRQQRAEVMVYVPEGFAQHVKKGGTAQVRLWVGAANIYTWGIAYPAAAGVVAQLDGELAVKSLLSHGLPPSAAARRAAPVVRAEHLLFHPTGGYGRYLMAGVLLIVLQQVVVISLAFSVGARRELGLYTPGRWPLGYLLGLITAHAPFYAVGILFAVLVVVPAFGWTVVSPLSTVALFTLFVLTLVPVAVAVASVAKDRMGTFQLLMFFSVPLFAASGFTWPADQMPPALRVVTAVFPATPALRAMRVLGTKSGSLTAVAPYLGWLGLQLLGYALVAPLVVRRSWTRLPGWPSWLAMGARGRLAAGDDQSAPALARFDVDIVHMKDQCRHRSHGGVAPGRPELAAGVHPLNCTNTSDATGAASRASTLGFALECHHE